MKNLDGKINTWLELGKWLFGRSNHTLIALLTALTENYGVKYGSNNHKKLMEKKVKLTEEFDEMLAGNSIFIYPTHPTGTFVILKSLYYDGYLTNFPFSSCTLSQ